MLCSKCSEVVRPVVAIDIDGTLGDYHGHFLRFATAYLGRSDIWWEGEKGYDGSLRFKEWVCYNASISEPIYQDIKLAYRQGAQKRTMPVYPDASRLVSEVQALGADLWLTTTRPYLRLDGIDPDTREWARRHQISYDGLLYDRLKYQILAERLDPGRVVAVLEDLGYLYDQAAGAFGSGVPILRKTRWNRGVDRPTHTPALDHAYGLIEARINEWREKNG